MHGLLLGSFHILRHWSSHTQLQLHMAYPFTVYWRLGNRKVRQQTVGSSHCRKYGWICYHVVHDQKSTRKSSQRFQYQEINFQSSRKKVSRCHLLWSVWNLQQDRVRCTSCIGLKLHLFILCVYLPDCFWQVDETEIIFAHCWFERYQLLDEYVYSCHCDSCLSITSNLRVRLD